MNVACEAMINPNTNLSGIIRTKRLFMDGVMTVATVLSSLILMKSKRI